MSDAKRRLDRQNAERSQAMAREAARVLADERVRLEGVALSRPDRAAPTDSKPQLVCLYTDGCPPDGPACHLCEHIQPGRGGTS